MRRFFILIPLLFTVSACTKDASLDSIAREQSATIKSLNAELKRVNAELEEIMASRSDFEKAKANLEKKMQREVGEGSLSIDLETRGLVVTVLDRILFDSGRPALKDSSLATLDKLAQILQNELADNMIYIEGHTDNTPIRLSAWRSNWELSIARAMEVVHYFIEAGNLNPKRLAATGYGEFHPVAENSTPEGRSKNRRVEIVISPKKIED